MPILRIRLSRRPLIASRMRKAAFNARSGDGNVAITASPIVFTDGAALLRDNISKGPMEESADDVFLVKIMQSDKGSLPRARSSRLGQVVGDIGTSQLLDSSHIQASSQQ